MTTPTESVLNRYSAVGDVVSLKKMLNELDIPKKSISQAFLVAARHGQSECLSFLLPLIDISEQADAAIHFSAVGGHAECLKMLLMLSNPETRHSQSLKHAAAHGFVECVKLLIPVSDPLNENSEALYMAVAYGHAECVKLLIPHSEPGTLNSRALRFAIKERNIETAMLLIPFSDTSEVVRLYQKIGAEKEILFLTTLEEHLSMAHTHISDDPCGETGKNRLHKRNATI